MANRRIDYTIGFKPDKTSLNSIYNSLKEIQQMTAKDYMLKFSKSDNIYQARVELEAIQGQVLNIANSYSKSFDSKLGVVNLRNFDNELQKCNIQSKDLFTILSKVGKEDVFSNIIKDSLTANVQLEKTTSFLDKMGETLTSTIRWGISSRLMNSFVGSVKGSFTYIKELDTSLSNIRIVTGKSADEMATFAKEANKAASALGSTTKTYTDASLIYFQQGLSDSEVKARAETTLKAANVTGQTGEEVSEQLTAVWNGYKVSAAETELYVDKLAAVAATTASDLEELSTGMSKVASAASIMGVDIDQLNGMLSTTISVTRQAPESVGTAFKTIFARIGDIEAGKGEISLGEYTSKMKEIGFNVLDANNKLRNQGQVIEEIGSKWNTLSREQQIALTQTMAGARQYNNLLALFDNWSMYTKAIETSKNATGTLQKQQDIYMQSTEAHLKELTAAQEQFQASLLDPNTINEVADALKAMFNVFAKGVDALGGGAGVLLNFGSILTQVFSKQIAANIMPIVNGFKAMGNQSKAVQQIVDNVKTMANLDSLGSKTAIPNLVKRVERDISALNYMNPQQLEQMIGYYTKIAELESDLEAHNIRKGETAGKLNLISKATGGKEITADTNFNSTEVNQMIDDRAGRIDQFTVSLQQIEEQSAALLTKSGDKQKQLAESVAQQAQDLLINFNSLNGLQFFDEKQYKATEQRIKEIQQLANEVLNPKTPIDKDTAIDNLPKELKEQIDARKKALLKNGPAVKEGRYLVYKDENENKITSKDIKEQFIQEYNDGIRTSVENTNALGEKIKEIVQDTQRATEANKGFVETLEEGKTPTEQLKGDIEAAKKNAEALKKSTDLQKNIDSVVQLTSSLGMSMSIMNNIANLPNIWQSQEDGVTKFAQISFNLAQTAIPAVVSGINTIATATTALQAAMGWIGIIGMALGAIVGIFQAVANAQENERKARIENNKAIIEENKLRQEEIDSNTALCNNYIELEKKYKNGDISKKELLSSTDELIDAYDVENGKLYQLTGQYDKLAEAIKKKRLEEARDKRDIAKSSLEANLDTFKANSGNKDLNELLSKNIYFTEDANDKKLYQIQEIFEKAGLKTQISTSAMSGVTSLDFIKDQDVNLNDPNNILKLQNAIQELADNSLYGELSTEVGGIYTILHGFVDNDTTDLKQSLLEANQAEFEFQIKDSDIESITSYEEYVKALKTLQNSMNISSDEFYSLVEGLGTTYSSRFAALERILNNPLQTGVSEFLKSLSDEDLAIAVTLGINEQDSVESIKAAIEAAKQQLSTKDTTIFVDIRAKLGTEDIKEAKNELSEYADLLEDIEDRSLFRQVNALEGIEDTMLNDNQQYIQDMFLSDKEKDAQLEKYKEEQKKVYEQNPQLANYNAIKNEDLTSISKNNNTKINSQSDYELYRQKSFLYDSQGNLKEEIKNFYEEVDGKLKLIEGKTQEDVITALFGGEDGVKLLEDANIRLAILNKGIKAVTDSLTTKEINNLVFNQIEEETNQILANINAIKDAGSLIGEGFVVATDDIEEFASKFPELLKDYEVLSDGSIKLSQAQVEATIGNIHEEQKVKTEAQIQEIDQQIALTEIKIKFLEKQRENTLSFLRGEISQQEYLDNVKTTGAEYEKNLQDALTKNGIENGAISLESQTKIIGKEMDNVNALGEAYSKLGATASAALMGQDPGEWIDAAINAAVSESEAISQGFLDMIGSEINLAELDEDSRKAVDQAYAYLATTNKELEEQKTILETLRQQKVMLESGINASIDSVNDGLAEQIDLLEDILDIYHDINNELTQIDTLLNKVTEEQDRLNGQDYVNSLNDQNKLLDAQIDKLKQKKNIGKAEAAGLKDQLTGYGFIFNEDGTVANYESAMLANAQIVQDAQMSGDEDAAERAQEQYDQMKEALERYEEVILNEIPGYDEETREALNRQIENNIKKFHYELDLHVNLNTLEKDFNTFQQNILDENDLASKFNLQADYLFDSHAMSNITEQADEVQKIMGEIQKMENGQTSEIFGDNIAAAYEELETATKNLQDSTVEVKQAFDEALNTYLSMMDQLSEAIDEQQSLYDKVNSILEHRKNVISMVFGEDSYKEFDMYYQKQHENNLEAIEAARSSRDYWADVMAKEEEGSELWLKAKENWEASVDTLNSRVEDSISNLKAQYDNAIKLIFQKTNEQITNGKGLDYLKYEWDYIKEDSEQYLDNVDKAYQISKFSANIEKQINSSSSLSAKKRLSDFQQQELEMLEKKDKLSQYDIDRSNKKLEILQAQIALEDAQNNKSSMRLRRDSQGNYSYQFVADTSAVDKAQEDLQNSIHDLYTLDKERLQTTVDEYHNTWIKAQEEIAEAMRTLQGEELKARLKQIQDHYQPLLEGYSKDITEANDNLSASALSNLSLFSDEAKISTDDIVNYLTGDKTGSKKLENEFITSLKNVGVDFRDNLPGMANAGLTAIASDAGNTKSALDSMFDQVLQEADNFKTKLGEIENASGESFKDYTTNAGKAYEQTKKLVEYQGKLITQYKDKLGISRKTLTRLEELASKFGDITTNATTAANAAKALKDAMKLFKTKYTAKIDITGATAAINKLIKKLGEYTKKLGEISNYTVNPSIGSGSSGESDTKGEEKDPWIGKIVTWKGKITPFHYYKGDGTKKYLTDKQLYGNLLDVSIPDSTAYAQYKKNLHSSIQWEIIADAKTLNSNNKDGYRVKNVKTGYEGWVSKKDIAKLDTGGYTGVWNSKQGKMAMLHEKELVLNAKDTANILSAVQLMRKQQDLVNALSLSAIVQKQAMLDRINATVIPDIATAANTLDQNVHIEASFPNVRDSRQIEEAFDNLVNMASQYANRKLL